MSSDDRDPVSGHNTTGHEWNGIRELDTPVPRGILIFLGMTVIFAVSWWFLMPAWPLGSTYTKGLLDTDQRKIVEQNLRAATAQRSNWVEAIEISTFEEIKADDELMTIVRETGPRLFGDNCAACHGIEGTGRAGFPDLTDENWLWGGGPEAIAETMRVGINSGHPESRLVQMPAFGRDQMLDHSQIRNVAAYVHSLSDPEFSAPENVEHIAAGREVFAATCAACHGEDGTGIPEAGAPDLTDQFWIYGGDLGTIVTSIYGGRQGHMPTWEERLTPAEIKILALYVHSLGAEKP